MRKFLNKFLGQLCIAATLTGVASAADVDKKITDRIDAATAERLGIVQQVTTREDLVPTAAGIAAEIAANAPLAVQSIKRTIDAFAYRGLNEALRFEALSASVEFVSDDMPAGYAAKAKKQQAEFEGK